MPPQRKSAAIASNLRKQIVDGELRPGERLPSEAELQERWDVSRPTVRSALAELAHEGLVESRPGSGTYVRERRVLTYHAAVAERADGRPAGHSESDAYFSEVRAAGRVPTQEFTMRIEPADPEVAERLRLNPHDMVCARRCLRYVDGEPWSDQTSYYPLDISEQAGLLRPTDIRGGTIRAMAQAGHLEVGMIDETTARMPTPDEMRVLKILPGVPIIVYVRTAFTTARPVRVTMTTFPSDRNRLVYELGDLAAVSQPTDPA